MSDRISEKAICPFYLGIIRSKHFKGVECESMCTNLGFNATHFVRIDTFSELRDYADLFCCDLWQQCPYAKFLLEKKYGES